jgi:hypothetical protein
LIKLVGQLAMQLENVLHQFARIDFDFVASRPLWLGRQHGALVETLELLSRVAVSDPVSSSIMRRLMDAAPARLVGMALSSPACLWGLRHDDLVVSQRELAVAAADAMPDGESAELRDLLQRLTTDDGRRVLPVSGRCFDPRTGEPFAAHRCHRRSERHGVTAIAGDSLLQSRLVDGYPQVTAPDDFDAFCATLEAALDLITDQVKVPSMSLCDGVTHRKRAHQGRQQT